MNIFFADISKNQLVTWDDLFLEIGEVKVYSKYCLKSDFYEVFKQMIISLLLGKELVLLDADFSDDEVRRLEEGYFSDIDEPLVDCSLLQGLSRKEFFERISNVDPNWRLSLFTSGTTGLPKKVSHNFHSITRFVRISESHNSNTWGFAYNPTHMAGIQVFFQSLLNGNSIVRLFGLKKEMVFKAVSSFAVTNISATPSFYRLLLPAEGVYETVTRVTSGGEKFDKNIYRSLQSVFPNAKITNVYASTEAGTLFASSGNDFVIKPEFDNFIKVESGELLIHNSLMGYSDSFKDEWYRTGDVVEILSNSPLTFRFVSRKNEMINIGGYKVNPHEVEDVIREIPGVVEVKVYSKRNSVIGNVVCCDVVKGLINLDEESIRLQLKSKLQEFKIPRMIRFVNELATTRTGKIKRS